MGSPALPLETPSLPRPIFPIGNHSCIPNAETSFPENNFLLHLTALEDIEAGEVRQQGLGHCGMASHLGRRSLCPLHPPQILAVYLLRCPGRGIHALSHVGAARPHISA